MASQIVLAHVADHADDCPPVCFPQDSKMLANGVFPGPVAPSGCRADHHDQGGLFSGCVGEYLTSEHGDPHQLKVLGSYSSCPKQGVEVLTGNYRMTLQFRGDGRDLPAQGNRIDGGDVGNAAYSAGTTKEF